jgi:hypothetical protein
LIETLQSQRIAAISFKLIGSLTFVHRKKMSGAWGKPDSHALSAQLLAHLDAEVPEVRTKSAVGRLFTRPTSGRTVRLYVRFNPQNRSGFRPTTFDEP